MIPILFSGSETAFNTNGIGRLSDAAKCVVTEVRNGAYELEMEYPIDGVRFSDIALGSYIFCRPSRMANNQAFEVYEITKPLNGIVTIYAEHISYRLDRTPCMPFTASDVVSALAGLKTNAAESCPFTFWTNKATVANYKQTVPASIRERLGGVQGSILDIYGGGDYEFDMFNVKLWSRRGADRGFTIRYGKNLTDLKQEESIEETITGIVPYFANENVTVVLPEKVIESASASSYPYHRTVPVDLSSYYESTVPTVSQLRATANAYMASHSIGVPKVSLTVSFVNLADTEEYKDIAVLQDVQLCDTVTVTFEKLGVNATAKVEKTVWDVLNERYSSIELGDTRATLSSKIAATEKSVEDIPSVLQSAIEHATDLITGESGGYVVMHTNDEGKPYEILIMDTDDINTARNVWRWNQAGWGHSSTGYDGPYTLAATLDGGIVADFITAGTITGIRYNNGNGTFLVDASGNLTATNATIKGTIQAGSTITGASFSGGSINIGNGNFTVDSNGNLTATGATVSGTINASGGTFSGNINATGTISGGTLSGSLLRGGVMNGCSMMGSDIYSIDMDDPVTAGGYNVRINGPNIYFREGGSSYATLSLIDAGVIGELGGRAVQATGYWYFNSALFANQIELYNQSQGYPYIDFHDDGIASDYGCRIQANGNHQFNFTAAGGVWTHLYAAGFNVVSSRAFKENIEDISGEDALKLLRLRPVEFDYKDSGEHANGMIAEEVYEILPDMVTMPDNWNPDFYEEGVMSVPGIDYSKFVPYIIKLCQMQQQEIDSLKETVNG